MRYKLFCLAMVCIGMASLSLAESKEVTAFDKLRALSGDWEGTYAWSGGRNASGKIQARYYATGNNSALVEDLTVDGTPSMTTVYHLDGSDLRMTHFCAAQNQPRLKATSIDPNGEAITFSFVDITNLRSPKAGHVDGLDVHFLAADHTTLRFRFVADGKESFETIDLKRKN
jgi:hypothetical protein